MQKYIRTAQRKLTDLTHTNFHTVPADRKIVTFTFDDVPASAFEQAAPILDQHGIQGTFYIAMTFMEGHGPETMYNLDHLKAIDAKGHEIASHTYDHFHFYQAKDAAYIAQDLDKNTAEFARLGIDQQLLNFSYPFGEQTTLAKKNTHIRFQSSRGIDRGINQGKTDFNNLKAIQLYEGKYPISSMEALLDEFDKEGGWLIFYTHDVEENYSKYGCSPSYFEQAVKLCVDRSFEMKTVAEVVKELVK
ncbi:MAG: polysaccharide deacetylase family protein [Bacteroidota bacterium]